MAGDDDKGMVPHYKVSIDGEAIPVELTSNLVRIVVQSHVELIDMATITFRDDSMSGKIIDHKLFDQGNKVKIELGYVGELKPVFWGEIVAAEPSFPKGRPPTVQVRAYNPIHRMAQQRKTRTFKEMKDSQVANQIAGEYGFSPSVDDSGSTFPFLLQNNLTDYAFLKSRADLIGFELLVEDSTFHFRKPGAGDSSVTTLEWEKNIGELDFRITTGKQVGEVEVRSWDIEKKEAIIAKSSAGSEEAKMGGSPSGPETGKKAFGGKTIVVREPVLDQASADALAKGLLTALSMDHVAAEGRVWGVAEMLAGTVVDLTKFGATFDGPYYVTTAEHILDEDGYAVRFQLRRNVLKV